MADIKLFIDWFFNVVFNLWGTYVTHAPLYAKITFIIIIVFPLIKKIVRYIVTTGHVTV